MIVKYILEIWSPVLNKYQKLGEYPTLECAEIMLNKPYNRHNTRRLKKVSIEVLYTEKANANRDTV